MLRLKNITKIYDMGELKVHALKKLNVEFRKSEFVSILGPSGCGKTTLLNIIGGLDKYTSGDLIINGKSTKQYKDKDWDTYRNHSIGFVFQSYNLIPHQTVLENVELALTLSGVSKKERRKRAIDVLKKVGLKDKIKSKPNQLSGGQMQRVAIARALVNDPEIILADEPTGALDTQTSVQIMEILKEISKDKLIVMVTHNPELAETYSSRIVKLLDGELIDDSNPFKEEESIDEKQLLSVSEDKDLTKIERRKKNKKTKMSFFTALSLSFKNLLTKKGRTILVSFAGSIGIIGIALILAISSGFSTYVNKMQEDTLSSYPITIEAKNIDMTSMMASMFLTAGEGDANHEFDGIYPKDKISTLLDSVGTNLKANNLEKFYSYVQENFEEIEDYVSAIQCTYDLSLEFYTAGGEMIEPASTAMYDMVVIYSLYYFENETKTTMVDLGNGNYRFTGDDNSNYAFLDEYVQLAPLKTELQTNGYIELDELEVVALVSAIMGMPVSNYKYMNVGAFSEMIDNEELIKSQYDLIGESSRFIEGDNEALLVLDKNNEVDDFVLYALGLLDDDQMKSLLKTLVQGGEYNEKIDYNDVLGRKYKILTEADYFVEIGGDLKDIRNFLDKDLPEYNPITYLTYYNQIKQNSENEVEIVGIARLNEVSDTGSLSSGIVYSKALNDKMMAYHNDSVAVTEGLLDELKPGSPESISIYVNTFESKEKVQAFIDKYNETAENGDEISFTDYVGIIMSTVSVIINAITYVLIAFVGVSLVVSSIMIGIITYISVIERTKEIGILRSVGASKRDVKRVFTAESFIIGLSSGIFGIVVSLLLTIPINILLKHFTGLVGLASLPWLGAIVLVLISIILTLIAGLIPAQVAAKKDPVVSLRAN